MSCALRLDSIDPQEKRPTVIPAKDGGFVKDIEHDSVDLAMVETINRIGHILGMRTIA